MKHLNLIKISMHILVSCIVFFALNNSWADSLTVTKTWTTGDTLNADDLNQNFTDVKGAVDDNFTRTTNNATDIANNTTDIANNASDIANNASDIANNASDIANNATDIANNATDIGINATDISAVDSAVSTLQLEQGAVDTGITTTSVFDFTSTITNISSLTVNAPAAGVVVFTFTGSMSLREHVTGTQSAASCSISDSDTTMASAPLADLYIPGAIPSFNTTAGWLTPFSLSVPVVVAAAGNVIRYVNCQKVSGGGTTNGFVQYIQFHATYFPNQL
jgi:hypothetical protein